MCFETVSCLLCSPGWAWTHWLWIPEDPPALASLVLRLQMCNLPHPDEICPFSCAKDWTQEGLALTGQACKSPEKHSFYTYLREVWVLQTYACGGMRLLNPHSARGYWCLQWAELLPHYVRFGLSLMFSPGVEGKDPGTHAVVHVTPLALAYVGVYSTGRQGEGSWRQRNQNVKQSYNASQLSSWKRPTLNLSMPCVVGWMWQASGQLTGTFLGSVCLRSLIGQLAPSVSWDKQRYPTRTTM